MRPFGLATAWLLASIAIAGCASSQVTERQSYVGDEKLPRPDRILVYDFVATPADSLADSSQTGDPALNSVPPTKEAAEVDRKVGARVAEDLVAELQRKGFPAVRAVDQPDPRVGDIVIKGHFVSLSQGAAGKRVLLGFGSGKAELKTVVEGYQMTDQGLRPLGSSEVEAESGKMPGLVVPLAVVAATANPIGLIIGGAVKVAGEADGSDTIDGAAKRTAEQISKELVAEFDRQGWTQVAAVDPAPLDRAPPPIAGVADVTPDPVAGEDPFVVQLASFKTAEAAQQQWVELQARFPRLLDDRSQILQPASVAGVGRVYRLQTGPFPTQAAATDTCTQLMAEQQGCLVMRR